MNGNWDFLHCCDELSRCTPYVHEAKSPDVGRVSVCDQAHHLLAGQLQGKQLVQQAERRRHYTSGSNATDLHNKRVFGDLICILYFRVLCCENDAGVKHGPVRLLSSCALVTLKG